MKILKQWIIILSIAFVAEMMYRVGKIPIPGGVLGFLILFLLLYGGVLKLESIEEVSGSLLTHLTVFFVPVGVGLLKVMDLLKDDWLMLLLLSIISSITVFLTTAWAVQFLRRKPHE